MTIYIVYFSLYIYLHLLQEANMNITRHAYKRMQERDIPQALINIALQFGSENGNGEKVILDRKTLSDILASLNRWRKMLEKMQHRGGLTVVELEENIITAYYNDSYHEKKRLLK